MKPIVTLSSPWKTAVWLSCLCLTAQAGTLINNFDAPYDYLANGIIGDTNWDGMYLRFGDIPGGIVGANPAGATTIANSAVTYPGYLSLRSSGGDWAGNQDDGVFLWKLVTGDFDVSVQSSPFTLNGGIGYDNGPYQMAGLMARAYAPDNSGAPYSTTSTNAIENYLMVLRFQEFGLNEVNESTNGNRIEHTFADNDNDTNTTRYFRMVRSSLTNFTFYWKTNLGDAWVQITNNLPPGGVLVRSDLTGPLQVGLAQAPFSTATHDAVFTDFELSGDTVLFPAMPSAPSALVTTATNTSGSLTFSWTLGTPGDSSLVVLSGRPIQYNPVQGITYPANPGYGTAGTRLGGAGEYVVYSGSGTSVTVTNLGANNLTYYAAVYEFSTASPPVYNTASPATNAFPGPGVITGASLSAFTNNIPIGGAVPVVLTANFSTGDTSDQTANATWTSSDPTIASVNAAGVVTGVTNGTVTITGTFGAFSPTVSITVHTPVFTDNFGATHDYMTNGLQGSTWDGLFLNYGDLPGANRGNDGVAGQTYQLLANTNVLYLQAAGGSWRVAGNDGPYLFKVVSGDFQASVHVSCGTINFNYAGIMARLFDNSKTASQNAGGGTGGTETHVNWGNPQQGAPSARQTVDSGGTTVLAGVATTDRWLLMVRHNLTNFLVFEKANGGDPWNAVPSATLVLAEATNGTMQVGLFQEMRQAATDFASYDSFMLDGPGIVSPSGTQAPPPAANLSATVNADYSITYTWVAATAAGTPAQSMLVLRDGAPVTAQPSYGMGFILGPGTYPYPSSMSLGDGNFVVFRSANPPASTNNSATITGLIPGHTYYATAYTFAGAYPDRVFSPGVSVNLQDGQLLGIITPALASIPIGGLQGATVLGIFSGNTLLDISSAASIVSTNPAVVVTTNNVLTGISSGTTTVGIYISGSPYTNYISVTVRPPTFTDNFSVNHDYLANGVSGSAWGGVYPQGPSSNAVPDSPYLPTAGWGTFVADANLSSNNVLTITSLGDGWENDLSGGFFLFKYVPGDFQAAVHINYYDIAAYNQPGLLARAYAVDTNTMTVGAPLGVALPNTSGTNDLGEYWVSLCRFDEYGFGTYARLNLDSSVQQTTQPGQGDGNNWLLINRKNGTNFSFFMRASATAPWQPVPDKTVYQQMEFDGAPMQVGLMAGPWWWTLGDTRSVGFDSFMLDQTTGSPLSIRLAGNNVVLSWGPIPGTLQYSDSLTPPNWQTAPGTATLGPEGYSQSLPVSSSPRFFRLKQ
jgi:Bacterial Ig-like domain (group 2)